MGCGRVSPRGLGASTPAPSSRTAPPARRQPPQQALGRGPSRSCAPPGPRGAGPPPHGPRGRGPRVPPARLTSLDQSGQGESEADEERRVPGHHGWERADGAQRSTVSARAPEGVIGEEPGRRRRSRRGRNPAATAGPRPEPARARRGPGREEEGRARALASGRARRRRGEVGWDCDCGARGGASLQSRGRGLCTRGGAATCGRGWSLRGGARGHPAG